MSRFSYTIVNNVITAVIDSGSGTTIATIPDSVTSTSNNIFQNNTVITGFVCTSESLLNQFGTRVFNGCTNLTSVTLASTSLKSVSNSCFSGCTTLPTITIPSAVTFIATNAFQNCTGLTSVTLNCVGTTTNLNLNSFIGTTSINKTTMINLLAKGYTPSQLTTAGFDSSIISRYSYTISSNVITAISVNSVGSTYAVIPDSVTSTADSITFTKTDLTEVICTSNSLLNRFGSNLFIGSTNLTSVTLASTSLKSVSNSCFSGCTTLPTITIPSAVTLIDTLAFQNCTGLTSVTLNCVGTSTELSANSFIGTTNSINKSSMINLLAKGYTPSQLTSAGFVTSIISRYSYTISSNVITAVTDSGVGTTYAVIPDSVTSILSSIFAFNIDITEFVCTIDSSLNTFGSSVFRSCSNLTSVTLDTTYLTTIGVRCFSGCSKLPSIIIPNSVTSIGNTCFQTCSELTSVTLSNSLTLIQSSCFSGCSKLLDVIIPSAVTLIDTLAFENCTGLTSVTLNCVGTSTDLSANSFIGTTSINQTSINSLSTKGYTQLQLNNAGFKSRFSYTIVNNVITAVISGVGTTVATIPNSVTSTGDVIFENNTVITDLICSSDSFLSQFGNASFSGCTYLTNVTLSSISLKSVSNSCFSGCTALPNIIIPSEVTLIDTLAFENCTGLTSLTLNCVGTSTALNTNSFLGTSSMNDATVRILLSKGYLQPNLSSAGFKVVSRFSYDISNNVILSVIDNLYGTTIATIPDSVTSTSSNIFAFNTDITEFVCTIDSSLNRFGNSVFRSCTNLTSVTLGTTYLSSISTSCFQTCTSLPSIIIPSAVTSFGSSSFATCSALSSIIIRNSVTSIGINCFNTCTSLTSVTISNSLTSISNSCFKNCSSLPTVTIPNAVTLIDTLAFENCTGLTSVTLNCVGTSTDLSANSFLGTTNSINKSSMINLLAKGYTPSKLTSAGFVTSIISRYSYTISSNVITAVTDSGVGTTYTVIPDSVTSTSSNIFSNNTDLTEVICTTGSLLNQFGNTALSGCTNLTSVTLDSTSLKSVSNSCFSGCTELPNIIIPSAVTLIDTLAFENCTGLTSITLNCLGTSTDLSANSFIGTTSINQTSINTLSTKGYTQLQLNNAGFKSRFSYTISSNVITAVISGVGTTVATIPNSVTSTADVIFENNTVITDLICSSDSFLSQFGNASFSGCTNLTNVTLSSTSLKSVSNSCFSGCTTLPTITIPSEVTLIDTLAFENCTGLTSVTLNCVGTSTDLSANSFIGATSINQTSINSLSTKGYTQLQLNNAGFKSKFSYTISSNVITAVISGVGTTVATIPNSVTSTAISIFQNTDITDLICSSGSLLTQFGNTAFSGCTNLTNVTLSSTSLKSVSNSCFSGCIALPNIIIPSEVTLIDTLAFEICTGLTSVTLNCIGTSTDLSANSFIGTSSMNDATVRNLLSKGYTSTNLSNAGFNVVSRFSYDISNNVILSVIDNLFGSTIATIPDSVTSTSNSIFQNNTDITDLICTSGSSLSRFGNASFSACTNLSNVTLGSTSLKSVSASCFSGCSLVKSIIIPSAVTLIDTNAFQNCTGLTSVTLNCTGTSTVLGSNSFIGTSSINTTTIVNLLSKGYTQQQLIVAGFVFRFSYDISNNVITGVIDSGSGTTVAVIPDSVTSIADSVFLDNTLVTDFICTSSSLLNQFGSNVFQGCTHLTNVTLGAIYLTTISGYCFSGCSSLTNITIPNSVSSIGPACFSGCAALPRITLPNSLTSIIFNCFLNCSSLTSITIPISVTSFGTASFSGCAALQSITIPNSITSISNNCFSGCSSLTSIIIHSGITLIESYAFRNCTGLTSVTLNCTGTSTFLNINSFLGTTSMSQSTVNNLSAKGYTSAKLTNAGLIAPTAPANTSSLSYTYG
jgi:hypothetical protein